MTTALDVDALPTLLISEDISSLFDDPFPFPPNTIAHITHRRRLLDNSLFFDRLLALGAIQDPTEVYPPHNSDSFRALLDAVAKSTYDSMKRDCLVYYLLKFTGDGRETKFAEERCLLPVYVSLVEAFWHFDDGNDLERAVSLYSDARIVKEHTSKIIQTLSLAPHPSSSALILRFVRTSTPALTEPDDIRLYLHALAEHDFVAAWEYTQTFAERSKERLEVLGELVAWVAINAPQHPSALKHLLALPLSPYEDAILNNFVTNPPPALLQPPSSAPSSTYLPSPSPSQSQSQLQPSTHHLKHNPVSFLRDLYTVKLIQSNRFVDAIKFDTRRAASSSNSYSEFDRKRIIDRVFGILTPLERADVGSGLGGMFNMKSASGSSQTPLKTQAMHIPTEDSPSNLNASTHRSFNSVNLNSSQSLGQSQTQAFALWSSTSTSSPSTFSTPAHTRRDSGGSFTPQLSRSVNGSGKMKRSSLGSGFGGSPVGIGLGTPRKVAGLLPSVGVNGNGNANANGGLLFTPGASTSTSTKPSAPLISSSTSSSLSRSGQTQSQSQHRVNGNGYAQNRSPVASSTSVSPTGAVTATNVNGTTNTTALTPPSQRTNAFLAPNAFFKPPPVATSTRISPSSTGTGLGINGVQKPMARENEKNNGVVKNPKRKRARVSDFEEEMGDGEEVEAEALGATSSLKSKTKSTLNGKTKAKAQTRKVSSSKTVATAVKRSKQERDEDGEGVEEEEHYGRDRDSDTHVNPPGAFIEVNVDTETDVNTLPASSSLDSLTSATSSNKSKRVRQSGTTTATGTGTGTRARSRSRGGSLSSSVVPASVQANGTSENHESSSGTTTTKRTSRKRPAPTSPVIERISIPGTLFEEDEDEDEVNNGHRRNSIVPEPSSSSTLTVPARATKIRKLANGSTKKSGRYSRASSVGVSVDGDAQQTDDASVDEHGDGDGDGDGDDNSGSVPPESTRTRTEKTKSKSIKTVRRSTRLSTVVISPSESKGGEGEGDVRSSKPRKSTRGSKRK